jgi:hypothetical protein
MHDFQGFKKTRYPDFYARSILYIAAGIAIPVSARMSISVCSR